MFGTRRPHVVLRRHFPLAQPGVQEALDGATSTIALHPSRNSASPSRSLASYRDKKFAFYNHTVTCSLTLLIWVVIAFTLNTHSQNKRIQVKRYLNCVGFVEYPRTSRFKDGILVNLNALKPSCHMLFIHACIAMKCFSKLLHWLSNLGNASKTR